MEIHIPVAETSYSTQDSQLRVFQYKKLNNILYLNNKLFQFGKVETLLRSFGKNYEETLMHFFSICEYVTKEDQSKRIFQNLY